LEANSNSDVLSLLNTCRPLFSSFLRIRSSASSSTSPELAEARIELQSVLKDLQTDLEDLVETVKAVELDPYSFGLEIEEVRRRRQLVDEVGDEIERMSEELKKATTQNHNSRGVMFDSLPDPDQFDEDDDYAAAFEQQRQQEIMMEQDEALDGVFQTVRTLRQQGDVMGRELEEQAELLEEVDVIADRVGSKLQTGIKKIGVVIKQNEGVYPSTGPEYQLTCKKIPTQAVASQC
jgi:t-SNARE syntaxin family protein